MGRRTLTAVLVLVAVLVAAACGSSDDDKSTGSSGGSTASSSAPAAGFKDYKTVGLALAGARNDRSFYQSHYDGAKDAQKTVDFKLNVVDNLEEPQAQIEGFRNLARAGNDVVIGAGGVFYQAADQIAAQFPKTYFIVTQGSTSKFYKNVTSIAPDQAVASYVAGVVMAKLSKSKTIGVIGGLEIPPTAQNYQGIKLGAAATDPKVKVLNTTVGSFNDAAKAQSAAQAQIADGADVMFGFLDSGWPGLFKAVKGKDVTLVGNVFPRCDLSKQYAGTTISNSTAMVSKALVDLKQGSLKPGVTFYGVQDPDIQTFTLCPGFEKGDLQSTVEQTLADLNSGKIKLPAKALQPRPSYYKGQ
jgi:basic membrane protein A